MRFPSVASATHEADLPAAIVSMYASARRISVSLHFRIQPRRSKATEPVFNAAFAQVFDSELVVILLPLISFTSAGMMRLLLRAAAVRPALY